MTTSDQNTEPSGELNSLDDKSVYKAWIAALLGSIPLSWVASHYTSLSLSALMSTMIFASGLCVFVFTMLARKNARDD